MTNPISYDYKSFAVTSGQSDYDVKTQQTELFYNVKSASRMIIKTSQDITIKLNNAIYNAFPITVSDSPFQLPANYVDIKNIFITNTSGNTATVEIWLF